MATGLGYDSSNHNVLKHAIQTYLELSSQYVIITLYDAPAYN